jgi:hypothetical protein
MAYSLNLWMMADDKQAHRDFKNNIKSDKTLMPAQKITETKQLCAV